MAAADIEGGTAAGPEFGGWEGSEEAVVVGVVAALEAAAEGSVDLAAGRSGAVARAGAGSGSGE